MLINFIDRVKLLFFQKDSSFRKSIYEITGRYPHNISLYREAMAHRSAQYRGNRGQDKPVNNERLEYLGDAILEATVSDVVYHHFPNKREGFLTNTRSKLVQRETLNKLAARMGILDLVHSSSTSQSHNSNVGGNAFEALVGALYLDHGYQAVLQFVTEKMMDSRTLDLDDTAKKETNFKSKLLEWAQKNKLKCEFRIDRETNEGNSPHFETSVIIEGVVCGSGSGFSKKQAEQATARMAYTRLRKESGFKDSIFGAKEKRTAMEAHEYAALPRIDEIENAPNAGDVPATGAKKPVRRRQNRRPDVEQRKPETTEKGNQAQTSKEQEHGQKEQTQTTKEQGKQTSQEQTKQARQEQPKQRAPKPRQEKPQTETPKQSTEQQQNQRAERPAPEKKAPAETGNATPNEAPEKKKRPSRRHRPAKRAPGAASAAPEK